MMDYHRALWQHILLWYKFKNMIFVVWVMALNLFCAFFKLRDLKQIN